MKILFDQNISHRVLNRIQDSFPEAKHVREFNMQSSSDQIIWKFARENGFALLTFDSDFNDLATLYGIPPKIIWLRIGNTVTDNLAKIILQKKEAIDTFLNDPNFDDIACLEIDS